MPTLTLPITTAGVMPAAVAERMPAIVEWAQMAAFGAIADWLEILGYPVSGDIAPETAIALDGVFETLVRGMAMNNDAIANMNEEM